MDLPIGFGDRINAEQAVLAAFLDQRGAPTAQAIAIDAAILCEIMRRPALAAEKCANPGLPRMLAEAPVKMTVPRPSGASRRAASRPTRKPLKQPTRQKSSNCCAVSSRKSMR